MQRVSAGIFPVRGLCLKVSLWASWGAKLPAPALPCRQRGAARVGADGTLRTRRYGEGGSYISENSLRTYAHAFGVLIFLQLKAALVEVSCIFDSFGISELKPADAEPALLNALSLVGFLSPTNVSDKKLVES